MEIKKTNAYKSYKQSCKDVLKRFDYDKIMNQLIDLQKKRLKSWKSDMSKDKAAEYIRIDIKRRMAVSEVYNLMVELQSTLKYNINSFVDRLRGAGELEGATAADREAFANNIVRKGLDILNELEIASRTCYRLMEDMNAAIKAVNAINGIK